MATEVAIALPDNTNNRHFAGSFDSEIAKLSIAQGPAKNVLLSCSYMFFHAVLTHHAISLICDYGVVRMHSS